MVDFWESSVWGSMNLIAVLLVSLLSANVLKRKVKLLRDSLIPTAVLGGLLLLVIAAGYRHFFQTNLFETEFFGGDGVTMLEMITYHCLALGFIATSLNPSKEKFSKKRSKEVFNTGVATVSTYLIQAIVGMTITVIVSLFVMKEFFSVAGILLPFGFGQGTGQAMNYGNIYEMDYGFVGGKSFGLTVAALGFLSASLGGVLHLNLMKRSGKFTVAAEEKAEWLEGEDVQGMDEIPMNGSVDKTTIQMGFIFVTYLLAYFIMNLLGNWMPGLKSILYGFNFLFGVLIAVAVNSVLSVLRRTGLMKRQYINNFLMNRISGFFFDLMIVAGIAAIQMDAIKGYWGILLALGVCGMAITYGYVRFVSCRLFPEYKDEQFLAMYGMLTGTASTGIILVREVDRDLKSDAVENLVYQNLPAIIFGFPMMIVATMAPKQPYITLFLVVIYFVLMNVILFRGQIFRKKNRV